MTATGETRVPIAQALPRSGAAALSGGDGSASGGGRLSRQGAFWAVGLLLWLGLAAAWMSGPRAMEGGIEILFLLAPLVIVPLGLEVVARAAAREPFPILALAARVLQPVGAILAVVSFFPPRGRLAAALALPWLLTCVVISIAGMLRLVGGRSGPGPSEPARPAPAREGRSRDLLLRRETPCFAAAFAFLPVGGIWLALSRSGSAPMSFVEPIPLLTAVHFHYTGFALLVIAGMTGRTLTSASRSVRLLFLMTSVGLIGGTPLLAAGWVFSPALKLAGAMILSTSALVLAVLLALSSRRYGPLSARILLRISAGSLVVPMILAAIYALGESAQQPSLSIPRMVLFHGVLNVLGFALCGLLGWRAALRGEARSSGSQREPGSVASGPFTSGSFASGPFTTRSFASRPFRLGVRPAQTGRPPRQPSPRPVDGARPVAADSLASGSTQCGVPEPSTPGYPGHGGQSS